MLEVFVLEVAEGGEDGVGGGLAEAAEGGLLHGAADVLDFLDVVEFALAVGDFFEEGEEGAGADAAGGALAAGFVDAEFLVEAGDVDHAVVFVHDDHAAGAHDGAELLQVLVVPSRLKYSMK